MSEERLCCGVPAIHYRGLRTADHVATVTGKHQQGQRMELQDTDVYCSMSLNPLVLRELQICSKFIHNRTGNNTKYMYQDIFVIFIFNHFFLTDIGSYLTIPSKGRINTCYLYLGSMFKSKPANFTTYDVITEDILITGRSYICICGFPILVQSPV